MISFLLLHGDYLVAMLMMKSFPNNHHIIRAQHFTIQLYKVL